MHPVGWFFLFILGFAAQALSPLFLAATLFYQFCLISGRLSTSARTATFFACNFFAIAWIPFVTVSLWLVDDHSEWGPTDGDVYKIRTINGLLPAFVLVVFYLMGGIIAYRHTRLEDAYEEENARHHIVALKEYPLDPILEVRVYNKKQKNNHYKGRGARNDGSRRSAADKVGQTKIETRILRDAYDLHTLLKDYNQDSQDSATIAGTALAIITVIGARLTEYFVFQQEGDEGIVDGAGHALSLYVLSTIFFAGMLIIIYCSFAYVIVFYYDQVKVVLNLTYLAFPPSRIRRTDDCTPWDGFDSSAYDFNTNPPMPPSLVSYADSSHNHPGAMGQQMNSSITAMPTASPIDMDVHNGVDVVYPAQNPNARLQMYNLTHVRAWDEVRRVAAEVICSPDSVLNSYFTPTVTMVVIICIMSFVYIVVSYVFDTNNKAGPILFSVGVLVVIFLTYIFITLGVAKKARKHFKLHSVIVSRIAYDVACEIDMRTWRQQRNTDRISTRRPGMRDYSLPELLMLYQSISSLRTHMEAAPPRPHILGIEQRHVKYAIAYLLLISAIVLFFALMRSIKQGACDLPIDTNVSTQEPTPTPATAALLKMFGA